MSYGWASHNIEIDLTEGRIDKKENDPNLNETLLGGRGIGSKILWDRVSPETDPFSSDNLLIFGTGALTGTLAPSANRTVLTTRSPQTNFQTFSSMGGHWGAELKHAGYNTIVISGKSSKPVYLWINNERVEIREASHLWGKDVRETQKIIQGELKTKLVQILCIGQAGENKVSVSSIEHDTGGSFSRAGVGAIMGDKKLKAIAVYGTKDLNIAKPSEFIELCKKILRKSAKLRAFVDDWSHTRITGLVGLGAYGNLGETQPWPNVGDIHEDFLKKFSIRRPACYNCQLSCKSGIRLPEGWNAFFKCQSWFAFLLACKIQDFTFNAECYHLCERYGLDSMSTASVIAFAIDLYIKGILTEKDTGGVHLEYGNANLAFSLISKIARREGIGDVLANGVYEAARLIGRGAEEHAYHNKKLEIPPYNLWIPYLAFITAISEKGDPTRIAGAIPQHYFQKPVEERKALIEEGFWPYPEEFKKYFWDGFDWTGGDYERNVKMASYDWDKGTLADCTGLCIFWTGFWPYAPIQVADQVNLISYATGMDVDENEIIKIAKRAAMLLRAYNVILGLRRKDDTIHEKWFKKPRDEERYSRGSPNPPERALDHRTFNKWIDEYYKIRGLNSEGIPLEEELDNLDLDYVIQELQQRGLI